MNDMNFSNIVSSDLLHGESNMIKNKTFLCLKHFRLVLSTDNYNVLEIPD